MEIKEVKISTIQSYRDYPFELGTPDELDELAEDISKNGLERPVILRKIMDPKYDYEMIDGHRRAYALKKKGEAFVKSYILDCDSDMAAVIMCENNLSTRRGLLFSEQAAVYGMDLDALKRIIRKRSTDDKAAGAAAGADTELPENTTRAMLAKRYGLSAVNLSRFVRLTYLTSDLQSAVDEQRISFNAGVALSHLSEEEQEIVYKMLDAGTHLSLKAAEALKKEAKKRLTPMDAGEIGAVLGAAGEEVDCASEERPKKAGRASGARRKKAGRAECEMTATEPADQSDKAAAAAAQVADSAAAALSGARRGRAGKGRAHQAALALDASAKYLRITLIERRGKVPCPYGHAPGESWDIGSGADGLCPVARHVALPYADALSSGAGLPCKKDGEVLFCCPEPDTLNVFKIEIFKK